MSGTAMLRDEGAQAPDSGDTAETIGTLGCQGLPVSGSRQVTVSWVDVAGWLTRNAVPANQRYQ